MVYLILDTNIWINFVAKNNPSGLLEQLMQKEKKGDIILLTNKIIIKEWERNKSQTIKDCKKLIADHFESLKKLIAYLPQDNLKSAVNIILQNEKKFLTIAEERVENTEKLLRTCSKTPITQKMKLTAAEWGIERQAPFQKKGSVGDALILLSSAEYCKKHSLGVKDSIFVSYNHSDYTDGKNIEEIHDDLKSILDSANMIFKRNIGEALYLTPNLIKEIWAYMTSRLGDEWAESERKKWGITDHQLVL